MSFCFDFGHRSGNLVFCAKKLKIRINGDYSNFKMVVFRVNEKFLEGLFDSVVVINRKIKQSILTSLKKGFLLLCLSNQIYCSKNIHLNLVFKVIQEYLAPFAKVLVFSSNVHPNKSSPSLFILI